MQYFSQILKIRETEKGTDLIVHIPGEKVQGKIIKLRNGSIINSEIRIDDNRTITADQRKKIFATIKDISLFTGDHPEELRAWLLYDYCIKTGEMPFSLSNCSISQAREFITFIIDFILREDIPLSDLALSRTDDIDRYLWSCIKYKRCCICGKKAQIHHWDTVGANGGRKVDDSKLRKIALCEDHHLLAGSAVHRMGRESFEKKFHVYGIIYKEEG